MTDPFDDPAKPVATNFLKPSELIGTVAVIVPRRVAYQELKPWGETADTLYADVFLVKGEGAGAEFLNTEITNGKLVTQLGETLGKLVLGRFAYGEGKAGKKPVVFDKVAGEDRADAARWVQANQSRMDRSLAAARSIAAAEPPAGGGSWGTPPPVTVPDAPPF